MRIAKQILRFFITAGLLIAADIIIRQVLPFPLNQINVIFICLIWFSVFGVQSITVAALALPVVMSEISSPLPFGSLLVALCAGTAASRWVVQRIISGHPLLRLAGASASGMTIYLLAQNSASYILTGGGIDEPSSLILGAALYALLITSVCLLAVYLLLVRKNPRLKNNYLHGLKI